MDLREAFDQILAESGFFILLQRASRKIRCICWNQKYQESSPILYMERTKYRGTPLTMCPRCMGRGWISRIERHKVYRQNASQIISLPTNIRSLPVGQLSSDASVYWMRHNTHPKQGDIIYEVGWDGNKPTHLIKSYQISHAQDQRQENGRIEHYEVVAREHNLESRIRQFIIRKLGAVENYEVIH